jgi:glutamate-1-semialdehyde 2,1-aminomutase
MERLSPVGPVYQAGTLSGNPVAVAAGHAMLSLLTDEVYARLEALSEAFDAGVRPAVEAAGLSMTRVGSMFTVWFRSTPPQRFSEVAGCDLAAFGRFHRAALDRGLYLPPSQYEAAFLPASWTEAELRHGIDALVGALRATAL